MELRKLSRNGITYIGIFVYLYTYTYSELLLLILIKYKFYYTHLYRCEGGEGGRVTYAYTLYKIVGIKKTTEDMTGLIGVQV